MSTSDLLSRLYRLQSAAVAYYDGYCQDEAADDGPDLTGCSDEQHEAARELRDAIADCSLAETLHAAQSAASRLALLDDAGKIIRQTADLHSWYMALQDHDPSEGPARLAPAVDYEAAVSLAARLKAAGLEPGEGL
jgi:hypothetical protein